MKETILFFVFVSILGVNAKPSTPQLPPIEGKPLSDIDQETLCKIIDESSKKETNATFQKIFEDGKNILCVENDKDFVNRVFKCSFDGHQETIENIHTICNETTETSNDSCKFTADSLSCVTQGLARACSPAHQGLKHLALFTAIDYIVDRAKCFTEVVEAMEKLREERKEILPRKVHKIYFQFGDVE